MIKLMVGCNYAQELIDGYIDLNKKYAESGIQITEVYGSLGNDPIGCAREKDRLPSPFDIYDTISSISDKCRRHNIELNYTINKSCLGSTEDFQKYDYDNFIRFLDFLRGAGIKRVTVAHPLLMEIVQKENDLHANQSQIGIEVSTIYHLYSTRQLIFLKRNFPSINKLCANLMTNRDMSFLRTLFSECKKHEIDLELMANEACLFGCHNRMFHYNMQSHTKKHKRLFGNWPISYCTKLHHTIPAEWLKARLIRPEDMKNYQSHIGIENFKITGRTHTTEDQLRIVEIYMKQSHEGNLLDIFPHFKKIYDKNASAPPIFIDNKKLENFLDFWFNHPEFRCSEHCEVDCVLCENMIHAVGKVNGAVNGK